MDLGLLKRCGNNVTIWSQAKIVFPHNIEIGDESMIDDFAYIYGQGEGIKIGRFSHITVNCVLQSYGFLNIGDFVGIGPGGIVLAGSDDYRGEGLIGLGVLNKYRNIIRLPVNIRDHAHIGAGSIVLPGVTIGEGCSVGAGSLVIKDLPEWSICVGSPCKPIKSKPKEKQLEMAKKFLEEYYDQHR